jgi:N-acetylglucosamine transport system permease protein
MIMANTTVVNSKPTVSLKANRAGRVQQAVKHFFSYLPLSLWSLFTIFGMLWIFVTSFKTNRELYKSVWSLPAVMQLQNYVKAWAVVKMGDYFLNSVLVVFVSVAIILIVSAPIAYVLTRIKFFGSEFLSQFITAGMGIPYPLLFIPLFGMLASWGWANSLPGLIVVYVALSIPFTVFLLTGFFASLPVELEEAAALDGASPLQTFTTVILPLASPGILTAAIFNFIGLWNEYMLALIFITDAGKRTLSLGLYALQGSMQYTGDWVGLFAGIVIVMLPTALLFFFLSEKMISGITLGAVK